MILKNIDSKFETNVGNQNHHLTILATSKAMDILSRGLYSKPVEAVVRETATNAYDAHVSIGLQHKPFEITLPTYNESKFSIRDYGPGIEETKIRSIFATYFSSSKTNDNAQTGCLGLGSKSPLAVSDQFTVESWRDGFHCVWTIFKDSNGFPSMSDEPIIKKPTTDATGIKITVPVDYSKRQEFKEATHKVCKYFKTIPHITNDTQVVAPAKVTQFPNCWFEAGSGAYALMGNVMYPINPDIKGLEEFRDLSSQGKLVIPFEIGELDFDASRESLKYDADLTALLKMKYNEIVAEFAKTIHASIAASKDAFRAVQAFNRVVKNFSQSLATAIYKDMTYQGRPLSEYFPDRRNTNWDMDKLGKEGALYKINPHYKQKYSSVWNVSTEENVVFYYSDDGSKGAIARLASHYYEIGKTIINPQIIFINESVKLDEWLKLNFLSKEDVRPLSTIPKINRTTTTSSGRKKGGLFSIRGGSYKTYFWQAVPDKDIPAEGYYFVKKDDDILLLNDKKEEKQKDLVSIYPFLKKLGVLPEKLFGITKRYISAYKDDPKFIPAEVYIKGKLLELMDKYTLVQANETGSGTNDLASWAAIWPPEGKLIENLGTITSWRGNFHAYSQSCAYFGIPLVLDPSKKIDKETVYKNFPLLAYMVYSKPKPEHVHEYIRHFAKLKGVEY